MERSRHKGLGVFRFSEVHRERSRAFDPRFEVFLPLRVSGPIDFHLLAVWALNFHPASDAPFVDALRFYRRFLSRRDAIVAGDFNNSVFWDRPGKRTNFMNIVHPCLSWDSRARIIR